MVADSPSSTQGPPSSVKHKLAAFTRTIDGGGAAGICSAVLAISESAEILPGNPWSLINSITVTAVESSEYDVRVKFQVDRAGSLSPGTVTVVLNVTLIWHSFLTAPAITSL